MDNSRDVVEKEIRDLFFSEIVSAAIKNIVIKFPFLGYPVIGWIFATGVEWVAGKIWDEAEVYGVYMDVDFRERRNLREYQESEEVLRAVLNSDIIDEKEKEDAKKEYREKLRNLIRFNHK